MFDEVMQFKDDDSIVYKGNRDLHILIPQYYKSFQMIKVSDSVQTLGIFPMWFENDIDKKQFFLPAMVTMCPSEIVYTTKDGEEYVYCTFRKGDTFIKSKFVVKAEFIAYALFSMYLEKGRIPSLITYDAETFMFDIVANVTGSKISKFNHAIFELIYSHLARDPNNIQTPYRLTDMKEPPKILNLTDLPHITQTVTAKLESGYMAASINQALTNEVTTSSPLEELLRQ